MPRTPPVVKSMSLHSTNLLALLDSVGIIRHQNPAIERFCGCDQDDLVGGGIASNPHPEDGTRAMLAFEAVVADKRHHPESVEYRHRTVDDHRGMSEKTTSHGPFSVDEELA